MYRRAKLFIEGANGEVVIDGWAAENYLWNGWSYVLMNKENAVKLVQDLGGTVEYDPVKNEVVELFNPDQHETEDDLIHWTPHYNEEVDEVIFLVGSGYWTWTHEWLNSEFNNMHEALQVFVRAGRELSENWDNEYPTVYKDRKYPAYLPSFDEFVEEMAQMVLDEDDERLYKWKETIQ